MDGTVNGQMIFECGPGYGVLLRPTQFKILESSNSVAVGIPFNYKMFFCEYDRMKELRDRKMKILKVV